MKKMIISILLTLVYLIYPAISAEVIPFSSPENSYSIISGFILGLNKSAYISGYTFTSKEFAGVLVEAERRGVEIKIVLEANPVGEPINKEFLCSIQASGADVYIYHGKLNFLHAKYIIGDNSSTVVTSENFGPDGFGKNRGWGTVIEDFRIASDLLNVYLKDLEDAEKLKCENTPALPEYKHYTKSEKKIYINQSVKLIVAPDAVNDLISLMKSAKKSIYIEQFYIYKTWGNKPNPILEQAINMSREGIDVKILLDNSYYNTEEKDTKSNYNTVEYVMNISSSENLSLEAKLVDLDKLGFEKIHNKGAIIDNSTALISSINWNENSPRKNREIGVAITGDSSNYFVDKFMSDWQAQKSSAVPSGKISGKDYAGILFNIFLFILAVSGAMILIKKKFYSKSKIFV